MATKRTGKPVGRPPTGNAKQGVFSRIDPLAIKALDEIRTRMKPKPSRAQLIDVAVQEYVERNRAKK